MTREEILALKAGPELDALVAEKVMGIKGRIGYWGPNKPHGTHQDYDFYGMDKVAAEAAYKLHWGREEEAHLCWWKENWGPLFIDCFSTDISAAWEVRERFDVCKIISSRDLNSTSVTLTCYAPEGFGTAVGKYGEEPVVLCRAALLAVMGVEA